MSGELGPDTLAVVVSHNGDGTIASTLSALQPQVREVVIIDNGSDPAMLANLRSMASDRNLAIIELPENLGIGAALNRGAEVAFAGGARWLLTMDQDSVVDPDFMQAMARAIEAYPEMRCATPAIDALGQVSGPIAQVTYAITSGNLVAVDLLREVGGFDERLFIDGVDFDFSLRVRDAGATIVRVPDARMRHALGDAKSRIPFHTKHSPRRRYYMYRNLVLLSRRHAHRWPAFIARLTIAHLLSAITIMLLGPKRRASLRCIALGLWDGLRGRSGAVTRQC